MQGRVDPSTFENTAVGCLEWRSRVAHPSLLGLVCARTPTPAHGVPRDLDDRALAIELGRPEMNDRIDPERMATSAAALHETQGSLSTARAIVERTRELISSAELVGITLRARRRRFVSLEASSDLARQLDDLQHALQTGPCISAATEPGFVRSGDVAGDPRWPAWGSQATAWGVNSVLSIGLFAKNEQFGALNMYSTTSGSFSDRDEVDQALIWGTHAATALAHVQQVEGLETAMASRHTIGMAQGIVMERFDIDENHAFALLSRLSQARNQKLRDMAAHVVTTRQLPGDDAPAARGSHEGSHEGSQEDADGADASG